MATSQYWRFAVTDVQNLGGSGGAFGIFQVGQLYFRNASSTVTLPSPSATDGDAPDGGVWNTAGSEGADKLVNTGDGNKALYLYGAGSPKRAEAIIDAGGSITADAIAFFTANDNSDRDPKDFTVDTGPSSTGPWTNVLTVTGATITTSRDTQTQDFPFGGGSPAVFIPIIGRGPGMALVGNSGLVN